MAMVKASSERQQFALLGLQTSKCSSWSTSPLPQSRVSSDSKKAGAPQTCPPETVLCGKITIFVNADFD
ncbi:hypothetical protein T265_04952 [Opisthorchis viverrini]|uniref:Uncharacterized protein n=1 Tax=Opisthorchis viverrini TaxID=6198 RepID=A0A075AFY9_OPIVI|nr:hypothetical protein T265_04952 [Opisthorchis viverrini]KER28199.1 hypothetical protein T265_04952 [Opisthorchis viverrini]